jgi:2-polyprenyl-3-methyl-5-hydroxy-6-metoxy-1,4-benzoquinol methylase
MAPRPQTVGRVALIVALATIVAVQHMLRCVPAASDDVDDTAPLGASTTPPRAPHSAAAANAQPSPSGMAPQPAMSVGDAALLRAINPNATTASVTATTGGQCPMFRFRSDKSADAKRAHASMVKYTRYVEQYCATTGMLQMHIPLRTYLGFLDIIATVVGLRRGDRVFDWGCGCGTMLNYYHQQFNTTGVGIDLTEAAVKHALQHRQPRQTFCFMDGASLKSFADNSFDAVVSWATLYHVRRSLVQCDIVHQIVRIMRPGAVAFIGHFRTDKAMAYWKNHQRKCPVPGATLVRRSDANTFRQPAFRRNSFFSIIVTKHNVTAA